MLFGRHVQQKTDYPNTFLMDASKFTHKLHQRLWKQFFEKQASISDILLMSVPKQWLGPAMKKMPRKSNTFLKSTYENSFLRHLYFSSFIIYKEFVTTEPETWYCLLIIISCLFYTKLQCLIWWQVTMDLDDNTTEPFKSTPFTRLTFILRIRWIISVQIIDASTIISHSPLGVWTVTILLYLIILH